MRRSRRVAIRVRSFVAVVVLLLAAALAAPAAGDPPAPVSCPSCWVPPLSTSFQVQLGGDDVDGYEMDTGFSISADEQLAYNAVLANDAHSRGLGAGFNNDPHQLPAMAQYFDWVLFEIDRDDIRPCYFRLSCRTLQAFRRVGKATFVLDYFKKRRNKMCNAARRRGFNAILKDLDLTAFRVPCRG